jgi:arginase family enzyme
MQLIKICFNNANNETLECENSSTDIIRELKEIKSNEKGKIIDNKMIKVDKIDTNTGDLLEDNLIIYENSKEMFEKNFKSFFLGGDHSITCPIALAFKKTELDPLLIIFDSLADCKSGKELYHRNWLRRVIDEGYNPNKLILVSARNLDSEEIDFIKDNKITLIKMDILREGLEDCCDVIMERARKSTGFYISIDIGCVDPAFAPGTYDLETGGFSSRDLIYMIKRLSLIENFKGADIVEVNPSRDINGITVKLAAKLLAEMV